MTTAPEIRFENDQMSIHFDTFDLDSYRLFLKVKTLPEYRLRFHDDSETWTVTAPARFAGFLGIEQPASSAADLPLASYLFDDQAEIVRMVLDAKRFAVWSDCGFGKTPIGLEVGRHVLHRKRGRGLIFTRNEIVNQWLDEARKFYGDSLPLIRLDTRAEMKQWAANGPPGLAVTNYEKLNHAREGMEGQIVREFQNLDLVVLDEGDRLRTQAGKQKWALIKSCEQIEYKLILTATPAPNDVAEFMSQAGFLNKFRAEESINTYFRRDEKTHRWTVKPHAREAFFRFMSTWSIYVRNPKRYGWRLDQPEVPEPIVTTIPVQITEDQVEWLHSLSSKPGDETCLPGMRADRDTNAIQRLKLSQVAKGFRYLTGETKGGKRKIKLIESRKPAVVAELARDEQSKGAQVLIWTTFDAESDILADQLAGLGVSFELLTGKTKPAERLAILDRFRRGETRCLVSRADMLGYGMNFQFCEAMIFSGWNDSYAAFYQALRRAYRFGQKVRLRVYLPVIPELEGDMLDNLGRKQSQDEAAAAEMERQYILIRKKLRKCA